MTLMVNDKVNFILDKLVNQFPAKEVFLFGSYAKGTQNEESDIDLCIIVEEYNKRKIEMIREARRILTPFTELPLDLLVCSGDEFYKRAILKTTFENKIMNEGIKIYEQ